MKRLGILTLAASALVLSGCADNEIQTHYEDTISASPSSTTKASAKVTLSKPTETEWREVFSNEYATQWRCAGTTLLIKTSQSGRTGITSIAHDKRCGGTP